MGILRLLLAFSVVLAHSHAFYGFTGMGGLAVPAFFIISGFYMNLILAEKYHSRIFLFYTIRILRLYPLYWAVLSIYAIIAAFPQPSVWPIGAISYKASYPVGLATDLSWPSIVAAIPNLFFIGSDILRQFIVDLHTMTLLPWPAGVDETQSLRGAYEYLVDPPIWSLGVEVVFYALAPAFSLLSTRRLVVLLFAMIAMQALTVAMLDLLWVHLTIPYNLGYFVLGMLAYRVGRHVKLVQPQWRVALAAVPIVLWFFWQALPVFVMFPHRNLSEFPPWIVCHWSVWTVFAAGLPFLFAFSKRSNLDQHVGNYAYPVYLIHMLFAWPMTPLGDWSGVAAFALSVLLSGLLIVLIDNPVEAWRKRRVELDGRNAVTATMPPVIAPNLDLDQTR